MEAAAITDHGTLSGVVEFYEQARKHGVKPILGCEVYLAASGSHKDRTDRRCYHLVLLAKNMSGYQNLMRLSTISYREGFYYFPRIDRALLATHSDGLIGLSACLGGEIAQTFLKHGGEAARAVALDYKRIFAPGDFYLELVANDLSEQHEVNAALKQMSRDLEIPLVATNDCHYLRQDEAEVHEAFMCIQLGRTKDDGTRLRERGSSYYVKSPGEMEAAFEDVPEAIANTMRIAHACNVELPLDGLIEPSFPLPAGVSATDYLRDAAREGLKKRLAKAAKRDFSLDEALYRARLERELDVIDQRRGSNYYLVVADFVRWAKKQGIAVGPGRGSSAGSLVAYTTGITDIDPIVFGLSFERFLNPERESFPDFDIDVEPNEREAVFAYLADKYGAANVAHVATFHELRPAGVIRDLGRVLDMPYADVDEIAQTVSRWSYRRGRSIAKTVQNDPELQDLYTEDESIRSMLKLADKLLGLRRHQGIFASGVIIAPEPVWSYAPCFSGPDGELVVQFDYRDSETAGLVRFDVLGLRCLEELRRATELVNSSYTAEDCELDLATIPLDDARVYQMISRGDTSGVFQLESSGIREILRKLKPDGFEDLAAAIALYRPGPLEGGMVDEFILRKHGRKATEYAHPTFEPVLRNTYGVIVYQEQLMEAAAAFAGYTLGKADLLRRAMGKKKARVMKEQKARFVPAAASVIGADESSAAEVFELLAFFAGYTFNRAHAIAYGLLTYQCAYLRCHYPTEFMAARIGGSQESLQDVWREAKREGIEVLGPDINTSSAEALVERKREGAHVRLGLSVVSGVSASTVKAIIGARENQGAYKSLADFCERADLVSPKVDELQALAEAGVFDGLTDGADGRSKAAQWLTSAKTRQSAAKKDGKRGQMGLAGFEGQVVPDVPRWPAQARKALERAVLGVYISGHPLEDYREVVSRHADTTIGELLAGEREPRPACIAGLVVGYRERPTRDGSRRLAFFELEDDTGALEVIVFPQAFEHLQDMLCDGALILCRGTVSDEGEGDELELRLFLEEAIPLPPLKKNQTEEPDI